MERTWMTTHAIEHVFGAVLRSLPKIPYLEPVREGLCGLGWEEVQEVLGFGMFSVLGVPGDIAAGVCCKVN